MKIFDGLPRTDYQDLLRALGLMLDERGLRDIRIWEHADGMIVQGRKSGSPTYETITFTDNQLHEILRDSYRRRAAPDPG
jgi:hypothetical protein